MSSPGTLAPCPRCKAPASGRFCDSCGAALKGAGCAVCSQPLNPGARFCHHCGAPTSTQTQTARSVLPWLVPGIAVLALVAFLIGQRVARGSSGATAEEPAPVPAAGSQAPDISAMSPEERASRLFDRVMRYSEQGKTDSLKIFAPMAIQSYEMVGPPDAHTRYDVGMIGIVSGDAPLARAEADTILASNKTHLLGLLLAMKAAGLRGDMTARAEYRRRFVAAEPSERAKKLKEYTDHQADIDAALKPAERSGERKP